MSLSNVYRDGALIYSESTKELTHSLSSAGRVGSWFPERVQPQRKLFGKVRLGKQSEIGRPFSRRLRTFAANLSFGASESRHKQFIQYEQLHVHRWRYKPDMRNLLQ